MNFIRDNRPALIFWLSFCFVLVAIGQIMIGPLGPLFAIALVIALIITLKMRSDKVKALIGLFVSTIIILGFFVVKTVNAESNTNVAAVETPVTQQLAQEVEEEQEAPKEECHNLDNFEDDIKQWCDLIVDYAGQYGQDPILIASIIQAEGSRGNPETPSSQGAIGLMQVMPSDSGWSYFTDRPTAEELKDPETNIFWGCKILVEKIKLGGNLRDGLRLYGPTDFGYGYADIVLGIYNEKSNQ